VSSDGLTAIGAGEKGTSAGIGLDLVCLLRVSAHVTFQAIIALRRERYRKGQSTINTQTLNSSAMCVSLLKN